MRIFNGKKEAKKILGELARKIRKEKIQPRLAVVAVAPDSSSRLYIKNKKKAAKKAGIKVVKYDFSAKSKEKEVIRKIEKLNDNPSVHGIIVQLPLPKKFNSSKIISKISPQKDVDGFQEGSIFQPVLPSAILIALKKADAGIKKKRVLAVVNSKIFGRTLEFFLEKKGIKMNYILRRDLAKSKTRRADVLITVCGCPGLIRGGMIKDGAILIDAGIVLKSGKIKGDVDRKDVAGKASFLTPVPGGIGPLTVALLLKNVYLAYGNSKNH